MKQPDPNSDIPAFPLTCEEPGIGKVCHPGMSLRDYFAAAAMQGAYSMLSHPEFDHMDFDDVAKRAYVQADAMIKARSK